MTRFQIFDKNFQRNKSHYLLQSLMATCSLVIILLTLDIAFHTVIIAAFGATSFIVFAMPNQITSNPRRIIGGYIVGIIVGMVFHYISNSMYSIISHHAIYSVAVALAVGLSLLLMVLTNTEHPPAADVTLGLVLEGYTFSSLGVILLGVIALVIIKKLMSRWLIDLF